MITALSKWSRQLVSTRSKIAGGTAPVLSPKSVLLAEDDPDVRAFAALVIHALGYEVVEANNGQEALAILKQRHERPVDLLMTDLMMPAMSGKDLADRLWRRFPMQRVLFFSGYPERMARQRWQLDPDVAFLQKPFSSHALAAKLREMLEDPALPSPARNL